MDDFLAKPVQAASLWAAMDRVVGKDEGVLDPNVLLAACGGDATILENIRRAFRAGLPDQLQAVQNALQDRDAPRLREAAHKLSGMVSAFSTRAASVASDLEENAVHGHLDEARRLVVQLEAIAQDLMHLTDAMSLKTVRHLAEIAHVNRVGSQ
jgi:hypothetical protein